MLNRSGITKKSYVNTTQILANVQLQASVGVIVDDSLGVEQSDGRKIAFAGTQLVVDFTDLTKHVDGSGTANAILLHDVDVTAGDANGTALYFGIVNKARVTDSTAKAALTAGTNVGNVMVVDID